MTIKKRLAASVMACAMAISAATAISANAKTLAESFYSSTSINYDHYSWPCDYWTKSSTAGTSGYYNSSKRHYVRATVGNPTNGDAVWADSGYKKGYGDIKTTATTDPVACSGWWWEFPTGYAYYGMC